MTGRRTQASRVSDALDVHALRSFEFIAPALKRRSRVLEVGCGAGRLARRLMRAGHRVTAIDIDADAVTKARRRGVNAHAVDLLDFDDARPFDAVVFVLSLHHILPSVSRAVAHAYALLNPGGLLIADEFGRERMNRSTACWFYETLDLLEAAGRFAPGVHDRHHGAADELPADPLERWRLHHAHDPPLHTGRGMRAAIGRRFGIVSEARVPHLFRYACRRMRRGEAGVRTARKVLEIESRGIAAGRLRPAGMEIVARKP